MYLTYQVQDRATVFHLTKNTRVHAALLYFGVCTIRAAAAAAAVYLKISDKIRTNLSMGGGLNSYQSQYGLGQKSPSRPPKESPSKLFSGVNLVVTENLRVNSKKRD